MSEGDGNGFSRVTNRELDAKIEAVRQEQKAEHWKTRLIVVGLTVAANAKALPLLVGFLGWHLPW